MDIYFAEKFHGHRSPGLILGLKMIEILYRKFPDLPKGKRIIGIAETKMCIPDALQIGSQATAGNKNLLIYDYGKLSLSIVRRENGQGYRISLRKEAIEASERIRKFLLREGKLSQEDRDRLIEDFLNLDDKYFKIEKIHVNIPPRDEQLEITECPNCGELQPKNFMLRADHEFLCKICAGEKYFDFCVNSD